MSCRRALHRRVGTQWLVFPVILVLLVSTAYMHGQEDQSSLDERAWFSLSPPVSDSAFRVLIHTDSEDISGWSFGLCHDLETAEVESFDTSPELLGLRAGNEPDFYKLELGSNGATPGIIQAVVLAFAETVLVPQRELGFPILDVKYRAHAESTVRMCDGLIGSGQPVVTAITIEGGQSYEPQVAASGFLVPALFSFDPPVSDGKVTVNIHTQSANIQGWSLALCHDPLAAGIISLELSEQLATIRNGDEPYFSVLEQGVSETSEGVIQAIILDAFTPLVLPPLEEGFPIFHVEYEVFAENALQFCDGLRGKGQPVETILSVHGQAYRPSTFSSGALVPKAFRDKLTYRTEPPESGEVVTVKLFTEEVQIEGWAFALCNTALAADIMEIATAPELEQILDGEPPAYVFNEISIADPFTVVKQSVYLGSHNQPLQLGPFPDGLSLLGIRYDVHTEDQLKFCDQVGGLTFDNRVFIDGIGYVPATRLGSVLAPGALGDLFIRGDADINGRLQLTDAVFILNALFLGGESLPCLDAADANDVGNVDVSDPIYVLNYLFMGDPAPPPPFPERGMDLHPETSLGCERGL